MTAKVEAKDKVEETAATTTNKQAKAKQTKHTGKRPKPAGKSTKSQPKKSTTKAEAASTEVKTPTAKTEKPIAEAEETDAPTQEPAAESKALVSQPVAPDVEPKTQEDIQEATATNTEPAALEETKEAEAVKDSDKHQNPEPRKTRVHTEKTRSKLPEKAFKGDAEVEDGVETLGTVRETFFEEYLIGKRNASQGSIYTYGSDYDRFLAYFGYHKDVKAIKVQSVTAFAKSPECCNRDLTKSSKKNAAVTIAKTLRLLKMLLEWLEATGRIEKAPIPSNLAMGGLSIADQERKAKERETKNKERKVQMAKDKLTKLKGQVARIEAEVADA